MRVIRGRKAVVTGAASGIGRAIAIALAREGADLYLIDLDGAGLADVAGEARSHDVEARIAICDLAQPAEITAAVSALLSVWDQVHILVNNAGVAYYGPTHLMTPDQCQWTIAVNLLAPIQLVRELLPKLLSVEESHILNVSSILGLIPSRRLAAYQTTKFGLVGFSAALRAEYSRRGLGVTALCPGSVHTSINARAALANADMRPPELPPWLSASPQSVAAKAVAAIRKNRGLVLVTPVARVAWWLTRMFPGAADWVAGEGWRRQRTRQRSPPR
jgi:short-subunit dehydrogenase